MKIAAAADLHYSELNAGRLRALADSMCGSGADVLVVAGDAAAGGAEELSAALSLFEAFEGPRLLVAGNHDLWLESPPFHTWRRYDETLPALAAEHGFHYLDHGPFVLDDVAFIGCMGWYDYRFRQLESPADDIRVTPVKVAYGTDATVSFTPVLGGHEMSWEEMTEHDYAPKGLVWQTDGPPQVAVWNDGIHIDWGRPDPAMAEHFAGQLRAQAQEVAGSASHVVAMTHFVPFEEMTGGPFDDVKMAFGRAYTGSPLIGEVLREVDNLALVIFGHRHHQEVKELDGLVVADASIANPDEGPLLLTLP